MLIVFGYELYLLQIEMSVILAKLFQKLYHFKCTLLCVNPIINHIDIGLYNTPLFLFHLDIEPEKQHLLFLKVFVFQIIFYIYLFPMFVCMVHMCVWDPGNLTGIDSLLPSHGFLEMEAELSAMLGDLN